MLLVNRGAVWVSIGVGGGGVNRVDGSGTGAHCQVNLLIGILFSFHVGLADLSACIIDIDPVNDC